MMKNLIVIKRKVYSKLIIAAFMLISLSSFGQSRKLKDVQVSKLNFTHSLIKVEGDTTTYLQVELDRKQVTKIYRVFFKIGTKNHFGDVKSGIADLGTLEGKKTNVKFKVKKYNNNAIKLDLGELKPGTYYLGLRIEDDKNNMYEGSQKIIM